MPLLKSLICFIHHINTHNRGTFQYILNIFRTASYRGYSFFALLKYLAKKAEDDYRGLQARNF